MLGDSEVGFARVELVVPERGLMPLLLIDVGPLTRLTISADMLAVNGRERRRASTGDAEGSVLEGLGVPISSIPRTSLSS